MKTLLIVLSMSVCSIILMAVFTSCDPCIAPTGKPECCDAEILTITPTDSFNRLRVYIDLDRKYRSKTRICPCDSTLVEFHNATDFKPEEEPVAGRSTSRPEGNTLFSLPEMQIFDGNFVGPTSIPQLGDDHERPLRLAILDTGLADSLLAKHWAEIKGRRNMFDFTEDITDTRGHGSVVFSIIDRSATDRTSTNQIDYYIYKCINDEGIASTFTLACALKCAIQDSVDIINASLGAYVNDSIIRKIVQSELRRPALIVSQGNDCARADSFPHYPSDYERAFGIMGVNTYCADPGSGADIWGCSNGAPEPVVNIAAPCVITNTTGDSSAGTSFAAAYVSGRFADYLLSPGHVTSGGTNPYEIFRDTFRWDPDETQLSRKYLNAVEDCVNYLSLR